jgi:hypothetical protein
VVNSKHSVKLLRPELQKAQECRFSRCSGAFCSVADGPILSGEAGTLLRGSFFSRLRHVE